MSADHARPESITNCSIDFRKEEIKHLRCIYPFCTNDAFDEKIDAFKQCCGRAEDKLPGLNIVEQQLAKGHKLVESGPFIVPVASSSRRYLKALGIRLLNV